MKIDINQVEPNPFRDFQIDPFADEQIDKLASSYGQLGQFGAVPVRPHPTDKGMYQQASGHHTVEAMRRSGATEVNVECRERSDDAMALLMGVENLTQRNNNAGAIVDAVAAQAYLAAVSLVTSSGHLEMTPTNYARFLNGGPGRNAILERLRDPSGTKDYLIAKHQVQSALQTLKTTGKMTEIMAKAFDAAEAARVARAEAEAKRIKDIKDAGEKAAAKEAESERLKGEAAEKSIEDDARHKQEELEATYDVDCIHLFKVPQQEKTFRDVVLSLNGIRFFQKNQQVPLAKSILSEIDEIEKKRGTTLGSNTIKEMLNVHLRKAMKMQKNIDEKERAKLLLEKDKKRVSNLWGTVRRGLQQAESALEKLVLEQEQWNYDGPFEIDPDAVGKLRGIGKRFDRLSKELTGI